MTADETTCFPSDMAGEQRARSEAGRGSIELYEALATTRAIRRLRSASKALS